VRSSSGTLLADEVELLQGLPDGAGT